MNTVLATGVIGVVVAPLVTYLIAARQFSGRIATSDASDLWEESRSIRDWSQQRIHELNELVKRLEERIAEVETTNATLMAENIHLTQQVSKLEMKGNSDV